jgi:hypothetical protein
MKTSRLPLFLIPVVCGLAVAGNVALANTLDAPAADATLNSPLVPPYSGGINEVAKLAKSGVDESVVLAYIKNSSGPFRPSAGEIVKLHDEGVSSQIITAMLQRGNELQQQTPQTQAASYPAYTQAPVAPIVEQPVVYTQPVYTAPASTVVYIGGSYGYPTLSYRSCYFPSYYPHYYSYYPRVGFYGSFNPRFSFNGRIGGTHFSGNFGGGFRGGHFSSGGFRHR